MCSLIGVMASVLKIIELKHSVCAVYIVLFSENRNKVILMSVHSLINYICMF